MPAEKVNNLVNAHRLQVTTYDKKTYMTHIKGYCTRLKKKVQENDPERVKPFEEGCKKYFGEMVKNFSEISNFYTGEGMKDEGMVILERWENDTPYLYILKDGIREEKV